MRQAPQRSNVVAAGSGAAFEKRCPHALTPWQVRGCMERSTLCAVPASGIITLRSTRTAADRETRERLPETASRGACCGASRRHHTAHRLDHSAVMCGAPPDPRCPPSFVFFAGSLIPSFHNVTLNFLTIYGEGTWVLGLGRRADDAARA